MQRLIILLAAAVLALTLACEAAGGLGNALQNEAGETGGSDTQVPTATPWVQIPANVPTPDPTVAAAIASISDIGPPEICRKVRGRIEFITLRWPYLPNGLKMPEEEWVSAETILNDFILDETQARKDWGNRCLRVRIPNWSADSSKGGTRAQPYTPPRRAKARGVDRFTVLGLYPGLGRVELRTGGSSMGRELIYESSRGFCEFADWRPEAGDELPVLNFDHCWYIDHWD